MLVCHNSMLIAGWLNVQEPSGFQSIPVSASQGQLISSAAIHPVVCERLQVVELLIRPMQILYVHVLCFSSG